MKRFLITFALGAAAGAFGHWYLTQEQGRANLAEVRTNAVRIGAIVRDKAVEGYHDVKDELARTGTNVRETARNASDAVSHAASDARITAAVKTKLIGESGLGSLSIGVETTAGVVTLTGDATDPTQVVRAYNAAKTVDGVSRVVSRMQVTEEKKSK